MKTSRLNAIIATSAESDLLVKAQSFCARIGLVSSPVIPSQGSGLYSLMIVPRNAGEAHASIDPETDHACRMAEEWFGERENAGQLHWAAVEYGPFNGSAARIVDSSTHSDYCEQTAFC